MVGDGNQRGYRHLLEGFWDEARAHGLPLPTEDPISAASFCAARHKITSDLLKHILHEIAATAFGDGSVCNQRWHGKRVFAADGAKINVQRGEDLERAFGVPEGAYCPQVLVSILIDVCAKLPVDVEVAPFATSEREHLLAVLPSLEAGDVLVLDRGYPSHEVLQQLAQLGIDFLVRVPSSNTLSVIDELRESLSNDRVVTIVPPAGSPDSWRPLKLRAVKLRAPDGSESYFLSSLAREEFGLPELSELYHMRWDVEEFFKLSKGPYIGQGQFRSKSPSGVIQEIHALVLFIAITRLCMSTAATASEGEYSSMSQKGAVLALAAYVTRVLLAPDEQRALCELRALLERITRVREKPRPGRSFPRRSFRPARRWGPTGRRGDERHCPHGGSPALRAGSRAAPYLACGRAGDPRLVDPGDNYPDTGGPSLPDRVLPATATRSALLRGTSSPHGGLLQCPA
jgi:hypothetical protein